MLIIFAIAAAVVLFAVAAAAMGRVDGLDAMTRDLESPYLPDGPVAPVHVDEIEFAVGLRGYRMDQVDAVLDRLSVELAARDQYIAALERTIHAQPGMPPSP
ncbi:MAG TPA: DivIVA domain-containing protein [Jiangellaceae bacterium]